ncbi:hypothetical protein [Comamonas thiooxydans]|uniref:hypothetical protein n=1 Tax=Comamonas thiooxydans TaxID=363952 RepID=UPI001040D072|nr:hypothetical protein [Comamonas thiooxydans]
MHTTPTEVQIFAVIVGVAAGVQILGMAISGYLVSRREKAFSRYFDEAKKARIEDRFMSLVNSRACIGDSLRVVISRWNVSDYRRLYERAKSTST